MTRQKKTWMLVQFWATKTTVEVAQSAFLECGAIGLEIDEGLLPEGQRKFPDDRVLVKAYFEPAVGLDAEIQQTMARFFSECGFSLGDLEFSSQDEEDWQGNFVRSCTTFKVEPNIFIVPSFEIEAFKRQPAGELYLEMDPENAFGTGQHQTTKLCLKNIYETLTSMPMPHRGQLDCLDVGTGSGILAILMKKLGAGRILATETDEDALITAKKNAAKNGVIIDTLVVPEDHRYETSCYDLVVANILAPVLIHMADNLAQCLKPAAVLILSGILVNQSREVIDAYQRLGMTLVKEDRMDDWCALIFKK